jgi:hypothetical protein
MRSPGAGACIERERVTQPVRSDRQRRVLRRRTPQLVRTSRVFQRHVERLVTG